MTMTREKLNEIAKDYSTFLLSQEDVSGVSTAFDLVLDIVRSSIEIIGQTEPYATKSIARMEQAERELQSLKYEIEEIMEG